VRKHKWKLLVLVALALFAIAVFLARPVPGGERITWENYGQIKSGMSRSDVIALLGPPGVYTSHPAPSYDEKWTRHEEFGYPNRAGAEERWREKKVNEHWLSEDAFITVQFGADDLVNEKLFYAVKSTKHDPFEEFLSAARRLWRGWFR
jgi:hypothetical protein